MKTEHYRDCSGGACSCEERRYWRVFIISILITLLEIVGGIVSGSLALLSDAGHVFIDGVSCLAAIFVARLVRVDPDNEGRIRALGGFFHAGLLLLVVAIILWEFFSRLGNTPDIISEYMFVIALLGMVGNWYQHQVLKGVGHKHLTSHGLALHVLSDFWQSAAVVMVGIIIWLTGIDLFDQIISLLIALAMFKWCLSLTLKSLHLFKASKRY